MLFASSTDIIMSNHLKVRALFDQLGSGRQTHWNGKLLL